MRGAFVKALVELAGGDPRILLLTGDLGYMALEPFVEKFPNRFINVGVAEQNMVGIATGLAEAGYVPFVYSIVPFVVLRPFEFIRNGPIQHKWPVRVVGVGGGIEYATNGLSHYGLEDVAVMRSQPGMTVIAPADHQQTRNAILATWNLPGPIYYRLGKDDRTVVPGLDGRFEFGKPQVLREGKDVMMVAMGSVANEAAAAAKLLADQGVNCSLAVLASVHPPPADELASLLSRHKIAVSVEAHYRNGGLGSLLAEVIAEKGLACRLRRCGVEAVTGGVIGTQSFLYDRFGLSPAKLAAEVVRCVKG